MFYNELLIGKSKIGGSNLKRFFIFYQSSIIRRAITAFLCSSIFLMVNCAKVYTEGPDKEQEPASISTQSEFSFPPYNGPKTRIQVIRFGIPADIAMKYPELADKRVGWGLCNRIVEGFWETNRFEYVEEKKEIIKNLVEQWALSQTGIVTEETAIEPGSLKAPEYLVYAEVYDFGVSHSEEIMGLRVEEVNTTIIGIQIRMVNAATGEYIPASAIGEAKTKGIGIWATVDLDFDQTTVGIASQNAVNKAIIKLIKRIQK